MKTSRIPYPFAASKGAPFYRKIVSGGLLLLFAIVPFLILNGVEPAWGDAASRLKGNQARASQETTSLALGPYSYVTPDSDSKLDFKTLSESFQHKGLKGQRQETDLISLPLSPEGFWIVFEVYNESKSQSWYIDFGDAASGRLSLARKFAAVNISTGQTYALSEGLAIAGLPHSDNYPLPENVFLGTALPVTLESGKNNVIALYIKPDPTFGISFAPRLVSEKSFISSLLTGDPCTVLGGLFFISVMAVFTGLLYYTRQVTYLFLLAYYASLCALFFGVSQFFLSSLFVNGPVLLVLYTACSIFALLHTRANLKIESSDHPIENAIIIALCVLVSGGVGACVLAFGGDVTGIAVFAAINVLVYVGIIVISLFLDDDHPAVTRLYCGGWGTHLISFLVLGLGSVGFYSLNNLIVHSFWLFFIPQAAFFVGAGIKGVKHDEEKRRQSAMRRKHDDQAVARLQKSKEAADQARLLRVIERERELMSELREREIQRAEEMRHAKEIADKANMAKSAFLAVVSHEIRTPMTGIMGMVQLLEDTHMNRQQGDYVETIKKSGETMMTLLNDILDFEKIERGSMDIEEVRFDLPRMAKDIVTLMSGHAAQKNLDLGLSASPDLPQFVMGDPTRIRQILLNLVNNGLKFTHEGGVTIRLSSRIPEKSEGFEEGTALVLFSVVDTGIGISQEAQLKLFTPFTQAEASITRKYGGTGLGLAISDKLVDAMGGKIRVRSEIAKGTEFYFEIPMLLEVDAKDSETTSDDQPEMTETPPMKILVVEDNEMNRKVLEGLISKFGHDVRLAANGFEAIEQCEQEPPQLIFMDIQMSGMDGIEATRKIRSNINEAISRIPIIALTGNVMPEEIEEIYAAQMNGFLAKPIDAQRLNRIIYDAYRGVFERPLPPKASVQDPFANLTKQDLGIEIDDREVFEGQTSSAPAQSLSTADPKAFSFDDFKKKLEEDDSKEVNPLDYGKDVSEEKIDVSKKRKNDLNFGDDKELTEIQKFLLSQEGGTVSGTNSSPSSRGASAQPSSGKGDPLFSSQKRRANTDSGHNAIKPPASTERQTSPPPSPKERSSVMASPASATVKTDEPKLLDQSMLQSLVDTLGKEQFQKLLEGFLNKADEIVEQIEGVLASRDISALAARSHELKGMAANFGMAEVSRLAGLAEKASKTSESEQAFKQARLLKDANEKTKAAFSAWLGSL